MEVFKFVAVLFLILPLIFGHKVLLCSDNNLIKAIETPTGYCQTQGWYIASTGEVEGT